MEDFTGIDGCKVSTSIEADEVSVDVDEADDLSPVPNRALRASSAEVDEPIRTIFFGGGAVG